MNKIYLIAGEASGDNIAAKLMKQLKNIIPEIEFFGIGGEKMEAEGLNLLFSSREIAYMGFLEIVPHIFKIIRRISQTAENIEQINPDIVITIDSPGFSFRVAKKIKGKARLIHYVAPTVWAYKPERAKKIAQLYNHLLVILPFEPSYFTQEGLATTFVGHPAIEDLKTYPRQNFRDKHHLNDQDFLFCITPGSRKQEIKTLLPIFLQALDLVDKEAILAIPTQQHHFELIKSICKERKVIIVDESEKLALFSSCNFCLTKSGTVTTELAFYKIPMVIAHKINKISHWILKKLVKVKYVTIINLLANEEVIPELLQEDCTPQKIAFQINKEMTNLQNYRQKLEENLAKLNPNSKIPSLLAAETIANFLEQETK